MQTIIKILFLCSAISIMACKSMSREETISSSLSSSDGKLASRSGTTGNLDFSFEKKCHAVTSMEDARLPRQCQHKLIKSVCAQNSPNLSRALYYLIAQPGTTHAFQDVTLRANLGKQLDAEFRRVAASCFSKIEEDEPKNDKSQSRPTMKSVEDFQEWLVEHLMTQLRDGSETPNFRSFATLFAESTCRAIMTTHSRLLKNHGSFINLSSCQLSMERLDEGVATLEQECSKKTSEIIAVLAKSQNTQEAISDFLNKGYASACIEPGQERLCDYLYDHNLAVSKQFSIGKMSQLESHRCFSQMTNPKPKSKSQSTVSKKTRRSSKTHSHWLVSKCCQCQVSFFKRKMTSTTNNPLVDLFQGSSPYLSHADENNTCTSYNDKQIASRPINSAIYDYHYVSLCEDVYVAGPSCSFVEGEEYKRLWVTDNAEPAPTKYLSPRKFFESAYFSNLKDLESPEEIFPK